MIKAILFDLDGTLLPNDEALFAKLYFKAFATKIAPYGIEPNLFIESMQHAAKMMINNDGSKTNEEVFINAFLAKSSKDLSELMDVINDFYNNEYKESFPALSKDPISKEILEYCKEKGYKVILASNPLFPRIAYLNRAIYNDIREEDFTEITSYDLYHYCKPNPKYYQEILERNNLKPEEAIYFGNEPELDIKPASSIGIKSYLVGNNSLSSQEMLEIIKNL